VNTIKILIKNLHEMESFADKLVSFCKGNEIILLDGDLGVGKTTLVQLFAKHLGVTKIVKSPSYNIMYSYSSSKFNFDHFDLYRLDVNNMFKIDQEIFEYITNGQGVKLVEWPKTITKYLNNYLLIKIRILENNDRELLISSTNESIILNEVF
jgi:tRNA threonylcarbamoyladenosine biosynthesis protein TsaE